MEIFAIDPGNEYSAYCVMDSEYKLLEFAKLLNKDCINKMTEWILKKLKENYDCSENKVVIERVASYGMPVGREVFETCEWIGRYSQIAENYMNVEYIYRKDEKLCICGDSRAKDANIRQALIDRFAKHDLKNGKGTKKNPDYFYGVSADCWAAIAIAVTWLDKNNIQTKKGE